MKCEKEDCIREISIGFVHNGIVYCIRHCPNPNIGKYNDYVKKLVKTDEEIINLTEHI